MASNLIRNQSPFFPVTTTLVPARTRARTSPSRVGVARRESAGLVLGRQRPDGEIPEKDRDDQRRFVAKRESSLAGSRRLSERGVTDAHLGAA